jgi:hypothetical protein
MHIHPFRNEEEQEFSETSIHSGMRRNRNVAKHHPFRIEEEQKCSQTSSIQQ